MLPYDMLHVTPPMSAPDFVKGAFDDPLRHGSPDRHGRFRANQPRDGMRQENLEISQEVMASARALGAIGPAAGAALPALPVALAWGRVRVVVARGASLSVSTRVGSARSAGRRGGWTSALTRGGGFASVTR